MTTAEEDVLILVLNYDAFTPLFANVIPTEWLDKNSCAGRLLDRIFAESQEGEWRGAESLHDLLETDEERNYAARIRNDFDRETPEPGELERIADECLARLCSKHCERERREIDRKMEELDPNSPEVFELQKKRIALRQILRNPPHIRQGTTTR